MDDVSVVLRQEIRALAWDMVRLEQRMQAAAEAYQWSRVGELSDRRDQVCEQRSMLMRQAWQARLRRKEYA